MVNQIQARERLLETSELQILRTNNNIYADWDDSIWLFDDSNYPRLIAFISSMPLNLDC